MRILRFAIIIALLCLSCTYAFATTANAAQTSARQVQALQQIVANDRTVRAVLGSSFDVVRTQPVGYRPGLYVLDLATPNRSAGLRVLVNLATSAVVENRKLDPAQIFFTRSDVAQAFALVRNLPSLRALLGPTLWQYRASDAADPSRPQYRVEALPVRSTGRNDRCTVHRCLELLFHAPQGYVSGIRMLVDLTAGQRIEAPKNERAPGPLNRSPWGQQTRAIATQSAAEAPECRTLNFTTAPTSWKICWYYVTGPGLVLGPSSFKRPGLSAFNVVGDARVDEIFVPYATGSPRYYDTSFGFPLATITQNLCHGTLLDSGQACLEIRDRGLDWLSPGGGAPAGRRGEEIVLWSALYAANYLYIEEWGFRDDGALWGRVGATGQNLPGVETESHTHDFVWRIVPHLAGTGNSVNLAEVNEPVSGLTAPDVSAQITHPVGLLWNPQRFDELSVFAPGVSNGRGHTTAYRLVPNPTAGLAHHNEAFTREDLWATEGDPLDIDASMLPVYASENTSLVKTDIALWYRGSVHHYPRDEDGFYDRGGSWIGTTHSMWTGFLFTPRNLWDKSPLFP